MDKRDLGKVQQDNVSHAEYIRHVPDTLKTKEMCIEAVEENPWHLKDVPDNFKTQEM